MVQMKYHSLLIRIFIFVLQDRMKSYFLKRLHVVIFKRLGVANLLDGISCLARCCQNHQVGHFYIMWL